MRQLSPEASKLPVRRAFAIARMAVTVVMVGLAAPSVRAADDFPSRPIRLVVPFAAGASTDALARVMAVSMGATLGQTVIVDNRAGAGGMLAADQVAKSAPDGYTILLTSAGIVTINPSIYKQVPYDASRDFTPLTVAVRMPLILIVPPSSPLKTVPEFIAAAKAKPGGLTYGSSGIGTSMHLAGALFESSTRVEMLHVPYKGGAPAMNDLLGNQIGAMFVNAPSGLAQVRAGKVRAIAVGSEKRMPQLPEVPTIAESGVPGYDSDTWYGFVMPARAPAAVVEKLQAAITRALAENKSRLEAEGYTVDGGGGAAMARTVRDESAKWSAVIARVGIEKQ